MNKKWYLVLMAMIILFPIKGYALDSATIICNKTKLNKNEETTCQINTSNLGYEIASVQGSISLGDNLSLISSSYDSNKWMYFGDNFSVADIEFATKDSYLLANNLHIATFKIKANNNATGTSQISLNNIKVSDKNYVSKTLTCNPISITFSSSINTLTNLNIKDQPIDFNKDQTTYSFNTNLESLIISATPTDSKANVSGIGQRNLNYGLNEIKIIVTAEDGTPKEYLLNVTRIDNRSSNNNLKKLSLSVGTINFNKDKTIYNVDVDSKVDGITINAELADSKSSFVQGYNPRKVKLNYGNNKILIKVKSENEKEKTYTININRKDNRNNNNYLKEIKLSSGKIKFNREQLEYKVIVPFESQTININALCENKKSKVEIIGDSELLLGENVFVIKVVAENEEIREYKIIVNREEKITSNKLQNIEIEGYKIDFDPNEYYYIIKTNKSRLNIKVTLQDKNAKYKINGNNDLKDGNVISIIVTDNDGNNNKYKLIIVEQPNILLNILVTLLSVILSIILTIFIMKKKNIKNNLNTSSQENLKNDLNIEKQSNNNYLTEITKENLSIVELDKETNKIESDFISYNGLNNDFNSDYPRKSIIDDVRFNQYSSNVGHNEIFNENGFNNQSISDNSKENQNIVKPNNTIDSELYSMDNNFYNKN